MNVGKTTPMPRETIEAADRVMGRFFLIWELLQIPEFVTLYLQAVDSQKKVMDTVLPSLQLCLKRMSPEGRGAFVSLAAGSEVWRLYDTAARNQAVRLVKALKAETDKVSKALEDEIDWEGSVSYRTRLDSLLQPLGVPDLTKSLMAWDQHIWGWHAAIHDTGPIAGPFRNLLETEVMKGMTDLGPVELAKETPRQVRRRMEQEVGPLTRHYFRGGEPFDGLRRRIHLWVRNKVCGETISEITQDLQTDESRRATGVSPQRWVEQQISEATRILGAKVSSRRPRKGGSVASGK